MSDHPELAILAVLDSALSAATVTLTETHGLTHADDETPYYLRPRTNTASIATCLVATSGALRDILDAYRYAALHPAQPPSSG